MGDVPAEEPVQPGAEAPEETPASSEESGEKSLLDVAREAIDEATHDPAGEPGSSETAPPAEEASGQETQEEELTDEEVERDVPDDELKGLEARHQARFKKRIRKLLTQRNEARDFARTLGDPAKQFASVDRFINDNGIPAKDVAGIFELAAMIKRAQRGDIPAAQALKMLDDSYRNPLAQLAGQILPEDLRLKVEDGSLDEETAAELTRTRAEAQAARGHAEEIEQRSVQSRVNSFEHQVTDTTNRWWADRTQRDPDYAQVEPLVLDFMHAELGRSGPPRSTQEVMNRLNGAYFKAKELSRPAARPPINPPPRNSETPDASRPKLTEPKSVLEAARQGLAADDRGDQL